MRCEHRHITEMSDINRLPMQHIIAYITATMTSWKVQASCLKPQITIRI